MRYSNPYEGAGRIDLIRAKFYLASVLFYLAEEEVHEVSPYFLPV